MLQQPDYAGVTIVELAPTPALDDYLQAMRLTNEKAEQLIADNILLACYDKIVILSRHSTPENVILTARYRVI